MLLYDHPVYCDSSNTHICLIFFQLLHSRCRKRGRSKHLFGCRLLFSQEILVAAEGDELKADTASKNFDLNKRCT